MIDEAAEEAAKVLDGVVEEVVQQVAEDRKDEAAADAVAAVEKKVGEWNAVEYVRENTKWSEADGWNVHTHLIPSPYGWPRVGHIHEAI